LWANVKFSTNTKVKTKIKIFFINPALVYENVIFYLVLEFRVLLKYAFFPSVIYIA